MGCKCGSQIILCNLPVRFDTYRGCSHGCRYCFAQKKNDISHIERDESVDGLRSFIEGKRGNETEWCDWNIPIHWGGMSDPFQPVEKQIRASYECLKLLAETKYPFVVSTKGRLIADPEYLDLLAQCNCVLQISMVCSKYDRLERGTPSYEERLTILKTVSARVQRTIVRIQPYMPEVFHDVMKNIPRIAEAGAYGVMIGLHRYGKRVKRMHLVATAPDRRGFIHETLKKYGADREFEYHDLFHSPGFVYEKSAAATWGGIRLHPHYEAKTMQWFRSSGIAPESTLFWITGAEPRSPGQS